jgi:curli production assembly/transport component CsgG
MISQPLLTLHWRVFLVVGAAILGLAGCSMTPSRPPVQNTAVNVNAGASLTPTTRITRDLTKLPRPKFKVPVAVYAFRDQTGQFKSQPDSNLSNAVTQGSASIVVKALLDSGWYLPIEREGFQNLLTERRVAKALETPADKGKPGSSYPSLMAANYLIEGGVVGYESNVRTGGDGASLLGVGGDVKYRMDQVTVNLRSVDVRTGQVINSVSVTKTIFSHSLNANVYKFVAYKTLLQAEGGYSSNEPAQLAVKEAIESAVIHLTVQGIRDGAWALKDEKDWELPLVQSYLREAEANIADNLAGANDSSQPDAAPATVPMRASKLMLPPIPPLPIVPLRAVASNAPATPASPTQDTPTQPTHQAPVATQAPTPVPAPQAAQTPAPAQVPTQAPRLAPIPAPLALPAPAVAPAQQALQEATPPAMPLPALTSDARLPDSMPAAPTEPVAPAARESAKEVPMPQASVAPNLVSVPAPPLIAPLSSTMAEPMAEDVALVLASTSR